MYHTSCHTCLFNYIFLKKKKFNNWLIKTYKHKSMSFKLVDQKKNFSLKTFRHNIFYKRWWLNTLIIFKIKIFIFGYLFLSTIQLSISILYYNWFFLNYTKK